MGRNKAQNVLRTYGPPMTPEILASKWITKFRNVLFHNYISPPDRTNPVWYCNLASRGYEHILHFESQTKELSISSTDYPEYTTAHADKGKDLGRPQAPDDMVGFSTNPFACAAIIALHIECVLERLTRMKHGESLLGVQWQQLPLADRRAVNEILAGLDEARKMRAWDVLDESRDTAIALFPRVEGNIEQDILEGKCQPFFLTLKNSDSVSQRR